MEESELDWSDLRRRFEKFLAEHRAGSFLIVHDFDADGITAAAVLSTGLRRAGVQSIDRYCVGKVRNAWMPENRRVIEERAPDAVFLLDLGSKEEELVRGVPVCAIDHHHPEGTPPGGTLITTYGWSPTPNTSLIAWHLASTVADVDDLEWISALGIISDLGERAPFPLLARAKKEHKARWLKEATTLINAARRVDPELAPGLADLVLSFDGPRSFVESEEPAMRPLHAARRRLNEEMNEAKKAAPVFAGEVALVRVSSTCQVHPLIAQIWRTRLPKYHVLVSNDRYVEGWIHFSGRSSGEKKVRQLLQSIELPGDEGEFGHGHDHASGGVLPIERWNALLSLLGFDDSVHA